MVKYCALVVCTSYWKPKDDYVAKVIDALNGKIENGDFLVISEKAISTAKGCIIDEKDLKPNLAAKDLARFWMRIAWGYPVGIMCRFGHRLLNRLRNYPLESGSRHKQLALEQAGVLQALMFGSEGGIDGSNLPFSYVSLPLENAREVADEIHAKILMKLKRNVCVIVADTDKTYRFRNFFFTPRPKPMKGINSFGGVATYVVGRLLNLKKSSTPLAVAGCSIQASQALTITNIADRARGPGSGATVWDMASRFQVDINGVSWEMLSNIKHKPLVIVRKTSANKVNSRDK
ncbi:MAG: coenzyme F420-0:L-glutamate ligase [Candidatus Bathyarchaeia archaeon]|jgi:F420-0:gamma-glutamyl ligase-like protein